MIDQDVARRIKLFGTDVDGVMTDNAVYIGSVAGQRVEFKKFDIQDGLGIGILRASGIPVVWVSGRESEATRLRGVELKIDEVLQIDGAAKLPAMESLLARRGIAWEEVAFVGDDIADIPLLRRVGLPLAVANAVAEVRACAAFTTSASGGNGAVREAIEALLKARGSWPESVSGYLRARGDDAA
jgi:3-deoxy-D-manno-octulosonate 8-phosphate phosphatase (KDO 8-P phosphatase)